jgi:hypothetical protein
MAIRPRRAAPVPPAEVEHPHQIPPPAVWATLTAHQQANVLHTLVNMCQECLIPAEEVAHDCGSHVPEDHDSAPATQSRDLHVIS